MLKICKTKGNIQPEGKIRPIRTFMFFLQGFLPGIWCRTNRVSCLLNTCKTEGKIRPPKPSNFFFKVFFLALSVGLIESLVLFSLQGFLPGSQCRTNRESLSSSSQCMTNRETFSSLSRHRTSRETIFLALGKD
jgi:hypothetical protein